MMMLSSLVTVAALFSTVAAQVIPTAPSPGQTFNEGSACPMQYTPDTTGVWTNMSVDLMTGSNTAMVHVTNVFSGISGIGGTGMLTWTCPQVTPNSAIYFYQFTNDGINATWTTRFAIATTSGTTTPPTNSTQPGGAAIPWGTGRLVSNSTINPSNSTSATSSATSTTATTTVASSTTTSATSASASSSSSSSTTTSAAPSATTTKSSAGSLLKVEGARAAGLAVVVGMGLAMLA